MSVLLNVSKTVLLVHGFDIVDLVGIAIGPIRKYKYGCKIRYVALIVIFDNGITKITVSGDFSPTSNKCVFFKWC